MVRTTCVRRASATAGSRDFRSREARDVGATAGLARLDVRGQAPWVIDTAVQNNPSAQRAVRRGAPFSSLSLSLSPR